MKNEKSIVGEVKRVNLKSVAGVFFLAASALAMNGSAMNPVNVESGVNTNFLKATAEHGGQVESKAFESTSRFGAQQGTQTLKQQLNIESLQKVLSSGAISNVIKSNLFVASTRSILNIVTTKQETKAGSIQDSEQELFAELVKSVDVNKDLGTNRQANQKDTTAESTAESGGIKDGLKREDIIKNYNNYNYSYLFKTINEHQDFAKRLNSNPDLNQEQKRWVYEDFVERALLIEKMLPLLNASAQSSALDVSKDVIKERTEFFENLRTKLKQSVDTKEYANTLQETMDEIFSKNESAHNVVKNGVEKSGAKSYAIAKEQYEFWNNAYVNLDSMKKVIEQKELWSSSAHFLDDFEQKVIQSLSNSKFSNSKTMEMKDTKDFTAFFVDNNNEVQPPMLSVEENNPPNALNASITVQGAVQKEQAQKTAENKQQGNTSKVDDTEAKLSVIGALERVSLLGERLFEAPGKLGKLIDAAPAMVARVVSGEPIKEAYSALKEKVLVGGMALSFVIHKDVAQKTLNELRETYGLEQIIISDFDKMSQLEQFEKCAQISIGLESFQKKMGLEKDQVGLGGTYKLHLTSATTMKATGTKAFVSVEGNTLVLSDFGIDNISHEWVHMLDSKIKDDALVRFGAKSGESKPLSAEEQVAKEKWKSLSKEEKDSVIDLTMYSDFPDELKKINMNAYESFWKLRSALHSVQESKSKEEFGAKIKEESPEPSESSDVAVLKNVGIDGYDVVVNGKEKDKDKDKDKEHRAVGSSAVVKHSEEKIKNNISKMLSSSVVEYTSTIIESYERDLKKNYELSQQDVSNDPLNKNSLRNLQQKLKELQTFNLSSENQRAALAWSNSIEGRDLIEAFAAGTLKEVQMSGASLSKNGKPIASNEMVKDFTEQIKRSIENLPDNKWISKENASLEELKAKNHELGTDDLLMNLKSKFVAQSVELDHSRIKNGIFTQRYWTQPAEEMARSIGRSTEISERLESNANRIKPGFDSPTGAAYTPKYDAEKMYKINSAFSEFANSVGVSVNIKIDAVDAIEVVSNEGYKVKQKVSALWAQMSSADSYKMASLKVESAKVESKLAVIDFIESSKILGSSFEGTKKVIDLVGFKMQRQAQNEKELAKFGPKIKSPSM